MEQRYKVDTRSTISVKGINIFQDFKSQQWRVVLEKIGGNYLVTIERTPLRNTDNGQDLNTLLEMAESVYARIVLRVGQNGDMEVDNKEEIFSNWDSVRKDIISTFGYDDEMETFCQNVKESLKDIDSYVKRSMIFFVLLSTFSKRDEFKIPTDSILAVGSPIELSIRRKEDAGEKEGKDILVHEGKAVPVDLQEVRAKYDKDLSEYVGAPFKYDFSFCTKYEYDHLKGGMFDNAVCKIHEHLSDGYIYKNSIEFSSLE
ncbi:hypothetical protein [Prevotella fusca]